MSPIVDPTKPFTYASKAVPETYVCGCCGQGNRKLWRYYQAFLSHQKLFCISCAAKNQGVDILAVNSRGMVTWEGKGHPSYQIGDLVPAVLTEENDSFWGYTAIPVEGGNWWMGLPNEFKSKKNMSKLLDQLKSFIPIQEDLINRMDDLLRIDDRCDWGAYWYPNWYNQLNEGKIIFETCPFDNGHGDTEVVTLEELYHPEIYLARRKQEREAVEALRMQAQVEQDQRLRDLEMAELARLREKYEPHMQN